MNKFLTILVLLLIAAGAFFLLQRDTDVPEEAINTTNWEQYQNDQFEFSLRYPAEDWNAEFAPDAPISPKFNFYVKPAGVPVDLPLDHFANISNISVFPEGIPTEGLFGQTVPFNLETNFEVTEDSRIYVLEDGTPFAAYIQPVNPPASWNDAGFIWMRVRVENLETRCERNGQPVTQEECDPLVANDQIVRNGSVDEQLWKAQQAALKTLELEEPQELIRVTNPTEGEVVTSPLSIEGEARGPWYFEASFPVVLTDWDGVIIAQGNAQAQGEWMTEEFVPFKAELTFESPYSAGDPEFMKRGTLILQKSNPSGLPENDDAREITIEFAAE